MLGYLIDEDEFEVKKAISRVVELVEVDTYVQRTKLKKYPENEREFDFNFLFVLFSRSSPNNLFLLKKI